MFIGVVGPTALGVDELVIRNTVAVVIEAVADLAGDRCRVAGGPGAGCGADLLTRALRTALPRSQAGSSDAHSVVVALAAIPVRHADRSAAEVSAGVPLGTAASLAQLSSASGGGCVNITALQADGREVLAHLGAAVGGPLAVAGIHTGHAL